MREGGRPPNRPKAALVRATVPGGNCGRVSPGVPLKESLMSPKSSAH
ncbi:MAG: hypothetical protein QOK29_3127, partial [Rhodospirillaceae bacterium]|nr:hypothetical protein [Rhodospirillaceae bacterium]